MQGTVAGTIDIGIGFDEPIDDSTGSALANYTVSSGTITAINWYSNRFTENSLNPLVMTRKQNALLTVSGFTGTSGSVTVKNVKDVYGNTITPVTLTFTVDTARKWGVVGGHVNIFGIIRATNIHNGDVLANACVRHSWNVSTPKIASHGGHG